MLEWSKLLSTVRRKSMHGSRESMNTGAGREELERDYDRILFLAPVRRLADKTQVFPLDKDDSVRTRLTHSHEVSNLARSIGVRLAFDHAELFGDKDDELAMKRVLPAILAATALAHDLGNPPFGHQGEEAIKQWFAENNISSTPEKDSDQANDSDKHDEPAKCLSLFDGKCHQDFLKFDGNAQTIRLLTKLQILNDQFGLNLACGTLAALMKYPSLSDSKNKGGYKKFGVFESERRVTKDVWEQTGLAEGVRHPLVYVMEACDDIAYSVLDAEDTVKKGYASFYDLIDYLEENAGSDEMVENVVAAARKRNSEFKKETLSSSELSDMSMQMFRVKAISEMIQAVTDSFVSNCKSFLDCTAKPGFELIENSTCDVLCEKLQEFNVRYGFQHRDVLKLELEGNNYIKSVMDMLWHAIEERDSDDPFAKYTYGRISENYRRVFESTDQSQYAKCQLLCDSIAGMTDTYLITLHDELRPLCDGFRSKK